MNDIQKLKMQITADFMVSQLNQIKLWKADDVDLVRLSRLCSNLAGDILSREGEGVESDPELEEYL